MGRRGVVTGAGVLAPEDAGVRNVRIPLTRGCTATRGLTLFAPSSFRFRAAAGADFDAEPRGPRSREIRHMDGAARSGVVTARRAPEDSGPDPAAFDPRRTGVAIGSAVGATT